jgi:hypothetical protein
MSTVSLPITKATVTRAETISRRVRPSLLGALLVKMLKQMSVRTSPLVAQIVKNLLSRQSVSYLNLRVVGCAGSVAVTF